MSDQSGSSLPLIGVLIGAAGFAASLTAVYRGMRDLMINSGGACASGGPYAIQNQCTGDQVTLLMGGIFAGLFFAGLLAWGSSRYTGGSFLGAGLLMWAALFGALGFNFIQLGFDPPKQMSGAGGWIVSGVVFWLMALGGLVPGIAEVASLMRRGSEPEPSMFKPPLVRANVPVPPMPGFPNGMPGSAPAAGGPASSEPPPATAGEFVDPVTGEHIDTGGTPSGERPGA